MFKGLAVPRHGGVLAATINISNLPLGKVIAINGQKFTKVKNDPDKGPQFLALQRVCYAGMFDGYDMQEFTPADCKCLPTPTATNYTLAGTLTDSRDGKSYEVRKFADGKCWMVDNLMYGGTTDSCAGVDAAGYTDAAYGGAAGMASPSNRFGAGTYGNCRDPRVGGSAPCTAGSTTCGYYYNWQATMQHPSAYNDTTYTGPTSQVQGICPPGWHVPSGSMLGEFYALHTAAGSSNIGFWQPGGNWKGVYSGSIGNAGTMFNQGSGMSQWSAGQNSVTGAWILGVDSSHVLSGAHTGNKNLGFAVRCIKDTTERTMQNFTTADCDSYPTPAGTDYTPVGTLKDERDGKWYEIRKFADGKCWMVDNLRYGGGSGTSADYCAGKATFRSADSAANSVATATNGLNPTDDSRNTLVGDCRDPRAAGNGTVAAPCTAGSTTCGYYYNWPAIIQNSVGWYGNSFQPTEPTTGICPSGWHVPSGNTGGEFFTLDVANGGTGAHQSSCTTASCNFWQPGGNWKGVSSGMCGNSGGLSGQGSNGHYWSSMQGNTGFADGLYFGGSNVYPCTGGYPKHFGLPVRCIKN